jgi:uncharacterized membrane protein YeaQ/YmgE (transglycosylase-associated protein family)
MMGMGLVYLAVVGLIAGFIAEKVMNSRHGLLTNLVVGIVGAYIGGYLAQALNIHFAGFIGTIIVATVGAVILLYALRILRN